VHESTTVKHAAEELSMAKGFCFNFFFLGEAQVSFSNGEEYHGHICRGGSFNGQGIYIYIYGRLGRPPPKVYIYTLYIYIPYIYIYIYIYMGGSGGHPPKYSYIKVKYRKFRGEAPVPPIASPSLPLMHK
jgi:hypothetical protein